MSATVFMDLLQRHNGRDRLRETLRHRCLRRLLDISLTVADSFCDDCYYGRDAEQASK